MFFTKRLTMILIFILKMIIYFLHILHFHCLLVQCYRSQYVVPYDVVVCIPTNDWDGATGTSTWRNTTLFGGDEWIINQSIINIIESNANRITVDFQHELKCLHNIPLFLRLTGWCHGNESIAGMNHLSRELILFTRKITVLPTSDPLVDFADSVC